MSGKGSLRTYSPEDVVVSVAGIFTLEGFAEGSFISIRRDAPLFESYESSDGMVSRVKRPSKTYTVTVTIMSTSSSNEFLTRLGLIDYHTHSGKFPVLIKDTLGKTLFFSGSSWIEDLPSTEFSDDIIGRQWSFKCSQATLFVGGNGSPSGIFEDIFNIATGAMPSVRQIFL